MPTTVQLNQINKGILSEMTDLAHKIGDIESLYAEQLDKLHDNFRISGLNLLHYLVLRSHDIRELQEYLHHNGLSSLTNSESHCLSQLVNVCRWIMPGKLDDISVPCDYQLAARLQHLHRQALLGSNAHKERPHIMVTISSEHIYERKLIERMLEEGMTIARINCAHDHPEAWQHMIVVLRKAISKTGKACKVYMDLSGPRIRIHSLSMKGRKETEGILLSEGMQLILAAHQTGSKKSYSTNKFSVIYVDPASIITMIKAGEPIFFDDGKFEAVIESVEKDHAQLKVVRISTKKPVLKPEKGINLPDSELTIPPLTEGDKKNIPFICKNADLIGYSFVGEATDIDALREEMRKSEPRNKPGIILKIERMAAVQNLPALLLNGMQDDTLGVMIARGDLAVEIGFERLSEIQEEILWLCEAAHVPVIWATQVLETLNKTGFATRSEITDAAMSVRAECVMLNKGPYIVKTISTLDNILIRQSGHRNKKRYIMRPLSIAKLFFDQA